MQGKKKKTRRAERSDPFDELEAPQLNTLAIGIFTHGELTIDESGKPIVIACPTNIGINKQNVGAYGCLSFTPDRIKDDPANYHETVETLMDFKHCFNSKEYIDKYSNPEEFVLNERLTPVRPLHKTEGACSTFENFVECIGKRYFIDSKSHDILFITSDDRVNIMSDPLKKLKRFFFKKRPADDESVLKLTEFVRTRDIHDDVDYYAKNLNTSHLFMLIELARDYLDIQKINILDKSCNAVKSSGRVLDPNDVCGPYSISCNGYPHNGTAFGGTRKKRKKSTNNVIVLYEITKSKKKKG